MDKPLPKPLPASSWSAVFLNKLKAAALALGGAPEVMPKAEEAHAFAAVLPYVFAHVQEARYNPDHKRIEVTLHGGSIRFHVPVVEAEEEPAATTPRRDVPSVLRVAG